MLAIAARLGLTLAQAMAMPMQELRLWAAFFQRQADRQREGRQ